MQGIIQQKYHSFVNVWYFGNVVSEGCKQAGNYPHSERGGKYKVDRETRKQVDMDLPFVMQKNIRGEKFDFYCKVRYFILDLLS